MVTEQAVASKTPAHPKSDRVHDVLASLPVHRPNAWLDAIVQEKESDTAPGTSATLDRLMTGLVWLVISIAIVATIALTLGVGGFVGQIQ
jgi:hypothetical protein